VCSLWLCACTGASWESPPAAHPYSLPTAIALVVEASDEVRESDEDGALAAMIEELQAELRRRDRQSGLMTADADPPPPARHVRIVVRN
jgi:hypothetical protein